MQRLQQTTVFERSGFSGGTSTLRSVIIIIIIIIIFRHGLGLWPVPASTHCHRTFVIWSADIPRLCVIAHEYFVFLGRVTNPSAKPPFLEDQFVSLSLASLLRPVRLARPYQEHKVPAGTARKVIEARKHHHPPPQEKVETIGGGVQ